MLGQERPMNAQPILHLLVALTLSQPIPADNSLPEHVNDLIRQLGDPAYTNRVAAARALDELGPAALPSLYDASPSQLEVRRRVDALVRSISGRVLVDVRRFTGHADGAITVAVSP